MKLDSIATKILSAALESGQRRMPVEAIARHAGCSIETLSKRLKDPEFKQLFLETMKSSLLAETPEILSAFLTEAKSGSFKHGKLILEITEVYAEKKRVDMDANLKVDNSSPFANDEERKEFLKATISKYTEEDD